MPLNQGYFFLREISKKPGKDKENQFVRLVFFLLSYFFQGRTGGSFSISQTPGFVIFSLINRQRCSQRHFIIGDKEKAAGIWGEALVVFNGRHEDLAQINEAAQKAGLDAPIAFEPPAGGDVVVGPSSTPGNPAPIPAAAPAAPQAPAP
ncbi:MAG TPA: hypothetical protein ENK96_04050, partial [Desulfobulbaceae bacterium]|nr:hypothetical protein [Desulfobulbaceae bacterium]